MGGIEEERGKSGSREGAEVTRRERGREKGV